MIKDRGCFFRYQHKPCINYFPLDLTVGICNHLYKINLSACSLKYTKVPRVAHVGSNNVYFVVSTLMTFYLGLLVQITVSFSITAHLSKVASGSTHPQSSFKVRLDSLEVHLIASTS